jgi:hypothetical protein
MASAVGPRSPEESRERTRFAAVSIGQTMRSVTTLAPELVAMSRNRIRCPSDLNDPTATTSLFVARESLTAAPITEYACTIASLLRSPEAVRAAAPNCSAKVSDANLTAPHRSATRSANVDFPEPGIPQTIMRRGRPTLSSMKKQCHAAHTITSVARASSVDGTGILRVWAVLRLMTNSKPLSGKRGSLSTVVSLLTIRPT